MAKKYDSVIIVGPTASGKTKLSIELAKLLNSEIISVDSQQLISGLDIGTAKVTTKEMDGIKHHLLDVVKVGDDFSVSEFRDKCMKIIDDLKAQNKLPVIVGGTGLYVNSLIYNYTFGNTSKDEELRNYYFKIANEKGNAYVYDVLLHLDPDAAKQIHPNNLKRVIRAIEIAKGGTIKKSQQVITKNPNLNPLIIGLNPSRETLFKNIDIRVDKMIEDGLRNETDKLYNNGIYNSNIVLPIGYSEWLPYYNGEKNIKEVVEQIKLDTRHYAKRQLTWFKKLGNVNWFNPEITPLNDILNSIMQTLNGSN